MGKICGDFRTYAQLIDMAMPAENIDASRNTEPLNYEIGQPDNPLDVH